MAMEPEDLTYYFVANLMNKKDSNALHVLLFFSISDFEILITNTVELSNIGRYPIADPITGATLSFSDRFHTETHQTLEPRWSSL